jgi:hypothetical protein
MFFLLTLSDAENPSGLTGGAPGTTMKNLCGGACIWRLLRSPYADGAVRLNPALAILNHLTYLGGAEVARYADSPEKFGT